MKTIYWVLVILFVWVTGAVAQTTNDEIRRAAEQADRIQREEQLRREQQTKEEVLRVRPPTVLEAPAVPTPEVKPAEVCREIKTIDVKGVTIFSENEINEITKPYLGLCLGVADIERLLGDITRKYFDKGYIGARVYLPQQNLSAGNLEILVVEGKVEAIRIDGRLRGILGNAFPGLIDRPLNLRDIEQGLDQVNRLSSNNATMGIEPGKEPGGSTIVIHNAPTKPWHLILSLDNTGSESTGKTQASATGILDSPFWLNDLLSFTHRRTVPTDWDKKMSESNSLNYTVPYGPNIFSLAVSRSEYVTNLETPGGEDLKSEGNTKTFNFGAERVIYRDQRNLLNLSANLTRKQSKNYLAGQYLEVSSRILSVLDLALSLRTPVAGGILTLDGGVAYGLKILNALEDPSGISDDSPHAQFTAYKLNADYFTAFALGEQRCSFTSQFSGQYTEDVLYGSEQISIGSLYSVRGFNNSSLSGDYGFYLRNDLGVELPFSNSKLTGSFKPYVGLDYGKVWSNAPDVPEGSLTGMATGVTMFLPLAFTNLNTDVFFMLPIEKDRTFSDENGGLYFRLSFNF